MKLSCASGECRGGYTNSRNDSYISDRSYGEHKFTRKSVRVTKLGEVQDGGSLWEHQASFGTVRANLRAKLYQYVQDPSLICPQECNQIFSFRDPPTYGYIECTEYPDIMPYSGETTRSEYHYSANAEGYCGSAATKDSQAKTPPASVVDDEDITVTEEDTDEYINYNYTQYEEGKMPTMACGEQKSIRILSIYRGGRWFGEKLCPEDRSLRGDDVPGRLPIEKQVCQRAQEAFEKATKKICKAEPGESCEPIITEKETSSFCHDKFNTVSCEVEAEVFCGQVRSGKPVISQKVPELSTSVIVASIVISLLALCLIAKRKHFTK